MIRLVIIYAKMFKDISKKFHVKSNSSYWALSYICRPALDRRLNLPCQVVVTCLRLLR